jgi:hypothetical protein
MLGWELDRPENPPSQRQCCIMDGDGMIRTRQQSVAQLAHPPVNAHSRGCAGLAFPEGGSGDLGPEDRKKLSLLKTQTTKTGNLLIVL